MMSKDHTPLKTILSCRTYLTETSKHTKTKHLLTSTLSVKANVTTIIPLQQRINFSRETSNKCISYRTRAIDSTISKVSVNITPFNPSHKPKHRHNSSNLSMKAEIISNWAATKIITISKWEELSLWLREKQVVSAQILKLWSSRICNNDVRTRYKHRTPIRKIT